MQLKSIYRNIKNYYFFILKIKSINISKKLFDTFILEYINHILICNYVTEKYFNIMSQIEEDELWERQLQ